MLPGFKANKFVDEVVKATEGIIVFPFLQFISLFMFNTLFILVANKKRAPPNFSWLEVYNPQLVWESGSDTDPPSSSASEPQPSSQNCHDAIPAHLNHKSDSEVSSPDVTAHRSSIATGTIPSLFSLHHYWITLHFSFSFQRWRHTHRC